MLVKEDMTRLEGLPCDVLVDLSILVRVSKVGGCVIGHVEVLELAAMVRTKLLEPLVCLDLEVVSELEAKYLDLIVFEESGGKDKHNE